MTSPWGCPRCGTRLAWINHSHEPTVVRCPRDGCDYRATVPGSVRPAEEVPNGRRGADS